MAVSAAQALVAGQHQRRVRPDGDERRSELGADQEARQMVHQRCRRQGAEEAERSHAEEKASGVRAAGVASRGEPRSNAAASNDGDGASDRASTECERSSSNSSPVIRVANETMRPFSIFTHLEWVPGRTIQATPLASRASRASTPATCVSSPRMTSGARARRVPGHAGDDAHAQALAALDGDQPLMERRDVDGAFEIVRLAPAVGTADHAARQHRQAVPASQSGTRPRRCRS